MLEFGKTEYSMTAQPSQLHGSTTYPGTTLPLTLLPGEDVLLTWETQSCAEELIVTTHRVRLSRRAMGWRWTRSIMLEAITACSLEFRSLIQFIVLAVLSIVGGLLAAIVAEKLWPIIVGILVGLLFVVFYVRSRNQVLEFTAPGAAIKVQSSGRSLDEVRHLIETIAAAKNARYVQQLSRGSIENGLPQRAPMSSPSNTTI
jgi:hypothetical protein